MFNREKNFIKAAETYLKGGFPALALKVAIEQGWNDSH
jgi:hypothetical protein